MGVAEIAKKQGQWCPHCVVGSGCRIYDERPQQCRIFNCAYLTQTVVSDEWWPAKSKIVLVGELDQNRIAAHVDPGRPGAWREAPYYATLKQWAAAVAPHNGQIVVCIGNRTIVVLPDHDVDLGVVAEDEEIVTRERPGPAGPVLTVIKRKRDDAAAT
jgi:hypothetical protein